MKKLKSVKEAVSIVEDGMTIMIGGFLGVGSPELLVEGLIQKNVKNLTLITNDTAFADTSYGRLIKNKMIKTVYTSHIGTNKETGRQMNNDTLEVHLVPQGTLIEQIRAAGSGLGGVITPTGVGTKVEEKKQTIELEGKKYIIEKPLKADVAFVKAFKTDHSGNLIYDKSARNFNPIIAMAADQVIVEADEIVEDGDLNPNYVVTPHIFVDYIVRGQKDD